MNLFVYGTLIVPEVIREVCGYTGEGVAASLADYRRRLVRNEVYPAIVPFSGDTVDGVIYHDVTARQLRLLDAFESDFYERCEVAVFVDTSVVQAQAYVLGEKNIACLSDQPWSLDTFRANGLYQFSSEYRGFLRAARDDAGDD